tara:strand:- start:3360 stop:4271 length:912 start_codon:yes stop_codon:yes gene_type:complete
MTSNLKNRQDDLKLYLYMEGNKVYFETYDNFKFTSIKIYFENELDDSNFALNQFQESSILNPAGDYRWTTIFNKEKKFIFLYGNVYQAISSDINPLFFTLQSNNQIIKVSDVTNDIAESVDVNLVGIDLVQLTQTLPILSGWNLVSFYILNSDMNINNLTLDHDEGSDPIFELKTIEEFSQYYAVNNTWFPDISDISLKSGYFVKYSPENESSIAYITLTGSTESNISIDLVEGINLIGYPLSEPSNINDKITNSTHLDEIKNLNEFSKYYITDDFTGWYPEITLNPSNGYIFKSIDNKVLIF